MRVRLTMPSLPLRLAAAALLAGGFASSAAAVSAGPAMVAHRAVYELTLDQDSTSDTVSDAEGRMVYDFAGSACDGFTTRLRFVTRISDEDGNARLTDVATTTFEDIAGKTFNFTTKSFVDGAISEDSAGSASRSNGKVEVKIAKPKSEQFTIAPNFQFPNQHLAAIIQAAQQGRHFVQVDLFDGSESGAKSYATSAVIGAENTGGDELGDEATAKGAGLTGIRFWPVTVSYFSGEPEGGEQKPSYELSFIMYENGITRRMRLDYGDFALRGKLVKLELTPAKMPAKGCR